MPTREIEHLSDRAFHLSCKTMEELFNEAAGIMYSLLKIQLRGEPLHRRLTLSASDPESLLVKYLSELLSMTEIENHAVDEAVLQITGNSLQADLTLSSIVRKMNYIKAVTYSELNISKTDKGFETNLVFDV